MVVVLFHWRALKDISTEVSENLISIQFILSCLSIHQLVLYISPQYTMREIEIIVLLNKKVILFVTKLIKKQYVRSC